MACNELLTTQEMAEADHLAIAGGVAGLVLMEAAGLAVADECLRLLNKPQGRIAILCGPGNNGGDGFVAARLLSARGYDVAVGLLGPPSRLRGDAAALWQRWSGETQPLSADVLAGADVVIDALFGAGLSRPLSGEVGDLVTALNQSGLPVLAVDVPSGLDGNTGLAGGPVVEAHRTVTFFRKKPGHILLPGRRLCGATFTADIGIPATVLDTISPGIFVNGPELWRSVFPVPGLEAHKYARGHAVVVSGPAESTGAARLGARAALRVGAGLVTLATPRAAFPVNAAHLTAIMITPFSGGEGLTKVLSDRRRNAVLIGPGLGLSDPQREQVLAALCSPAAAVLDADALSLFQDDPSQLFSAITEQPDRSVVLTPHDSEFARLFAVDDGAAKTDRVRSAAAVSGAVVILKGPDTVIAAPDGRIAINDNAPPWLATAGSGDVLAGFVTGLLAQGMPVFAAAAAAVWLHGAAATRFGPGLIAEDLPEVLPQVLSELYSTI